MSATFKPFADDEASVSVGGITVENGKDRIAFYGNLEIGRTPADLERVESLLAILGDVAKSIRSDPAHGEPPADEAPVTVKNPFA